MLAVRGRDNVNFATPNKEPIGDALPDLFSKSKIFATRSITKIHPIYLILHKPICEILLKIQRDCKNLF